MDETLEIIWSYTPKDYFEEPYEEDNGNYSLEIDDGHATVTMDAQRYDNNAEVLDEIFKEIEGLFAGAQLINHGPYELRQTGRTMYRKRPEGPGSISILAGPAKISVSAGSIDVKITDAEGNVTADTRADRIRERKELAQMAARHRPNDDVAKAILNSYDAAVRDRDNELVHLYEVYEALVSRFGGEEDVRSQLGVSRRRRRRLTTLANKEPLKQGRHRGYHVGQLRDATNEELNDAREIARSMIRAYLEYLDRQTGRHK